MTVRIETAVTVGYSCRLLSSSDTIETYIVDAGSAECVRAQLIAARDHLCNLLMAGQLTFDVTELAPWMKHVMAAACISHSSVQTAEMDRGCCALIINGHSLVTAHVILCFYVRLILPLIIRVSQFPSVLCSWVMGRASGQTFVASFPKVLPWRSWLT